MSEGKSQAGYEYGDSVYAHADDGPRVLKVLASGADGFTGEDEDGNQHQVPHDRYLGHHKRVKHAYEVEMEGEDGCIVRDESGQRRFIAGKPPSPPEGKQARDAAHRFSKLHTEDLKLGPAATLTKALAPLPPLLALPEGPALLLFLKAAGSGKVRSVKTKPAKHKHGDVIAFRHGAVEGTGRVVGSGQDGVTVVDEETGREHLVRHDAILDEHPPEERGKELSEADKSDTSAGEAS